MSRAWPVPLATTLTSIPVFCLNKGRIKPNSPESSVEVVEATRIDFPCAEASEICARTIAIANEIALRHLGMKFFLMWKSSLKGPALANHIRVYRGGNSDRAGVTTGHS